MYLKTWARHLNGIPIISIDYSLSPEARFPTQIQEALDVYLWLISEKKEVHDLLGFYPKKIVLVGDSAGANYLTGLALALNQIRQRQPSIIGNDLPTPIQM